MGPEFRAQRTGMAGLDRGIVDDFQANMLQAVIVTVTTDSGFL